MLEDSTIVPSSLLAFVAEVIMTNIPLTPTSGGGMCIADAALQPADIIVSTASGAVSGGIRFGTTSQVSHAALFAGSGQVIEAVGEGVLLRSLNASLSNHYLAVAYRVRGMNPGTASRIVQFARHWVGRKYDTLGAAAAGTRARVGSAVCVVVFGIVPCGAARAGAFKSSDKFYCSQLVLEAYRQAGASFVQQNPNTSYPQDIVTAYSHGKLQYVGHLISGKEDRRATTA
jgi:uncharacterized protein YycO